ncbi:hypothetical protein [Streptomyces sp. NRRL B-24484]|uniref:hypothetical protein n=1 Tax=Streptomyces sp. NRRL B-24484 TaxID=1463833 RepID=UPI0004C0D442|nr:hypothetical protein [Streptomyces sp. NRRL B-24484]
MSTDPPSPGQQPNGESPPSGPFDSGDLLLETLAAAVDAADDLSIGVVLYFGGGTINGLLISRAAWLQQWTAAIQVHRPDLGLGNMLQSLLEEATDGEVSRIGAGFVHLRDVTYRNGALTVTTQLWRGSIDRLNGWSLEGKMTTRAPRAPRPLDDTE